MSVFYLDNHPAIAEITQSLLERDVEVSHVQTGYTKRFRANHALNNVELLDIREARHCDKILSTANTQTAPVSHAMLAQLAECEMAFYDVLDRIRFEPLTIIQRRRLYFALLSYWESFLTRNPRVDMIVFRDPPHIGYDIVLYFLAALRNIKVVYFDNTNLEGYVLARSTHIRNKKVDSNKWADFTVDDLQQQIGDTLHDSVYHAPSTRADYNKRILALAQSGGMANRALEIIKGSALLIKHVVNGRKRNFTFTDCDGGDKGFLYFRRKQLKYLKNFYLYKIAYMRMQKMPDLGKHYVYFTLHLQPECSTSPFLADSFQDQVLAIELLSSLLPKHWIIYVKEHCMNHYAGLFSASDDDLINASLSKVNYIDKRNYARLAKLNNVVLIPTHISSRQMLYNAKAVATVTGTVGWEALLKGVSCIAFGKPWYAACNSCHEISSTQDLKRAMQLIQSAQPQTVLRDVAEFLVTYRSKLIDVGQYLPPGFDDNNRTEVGRKTAVGIQAVINVLSMKKSNISDYITVH